MPPSPFPLLVGLTPPGYLTHGFPPTSRPRPIFLCPSVLFFFCFGLVAQNRTLSPSVAHHDMLLFVSIPQTRHRFDGELQSPPTHLLPSFPLFSPPLKASLHPRSFPLEFLKLGPIASASFRSDSFLGFIVNLNFRVNVTSPVVSFALHATGGFYTFYPFPPLLFFYLPLSLDVSPKSRAFRPFRKIIPTTFPPRPD